MNVEFHPFGAAVVALTFVEFAAALAIGAAGLRAAGAGTRALFVVGSVVLAVTLCSGGPLGAFVVERIVDGAAADRARDGLDLFNRVVGSVGLACVAAGVWRSTTAT